MTSNHPQTPKVSIWRTLYSAFFGTLQNSINTISLLVSIGSLVFTIIVWRSPEPTPNHIVIRDLIILSALLVALGLLWYRHIQREAVIQNQKLSIDQYYTHLSRLLKENYEIIHNYRNEIFPYFLPYISHSTVYDVTERDLKLFRKVCFFITSGVRESFLELFTARGIDIDQDVSVSVKLLIQPNRVNQLFEPVLQLDDKGKERLRTAQPFVVVTVYRDQYTYRHHRYREVGGVRLYNVINNTAFHHVWLGGQQYFCSNDLQALGDTYLNENTEWRKHYNATLVVPIRYRDPVSGWQLCFGFLAVDSLNPDKIPDLYDGTNCRHILSHAADILATFFLSLALNKSDPGGMYDSQQ